MDFLDGMRVFVAAVETGSFTGAGQRLGLSPKLASKYMAELEDRLGTRLLQRTTRQLGMTAAGERLYARAPDWLDELDEIAAAVREPRSGLTGTLRVSAPVTFGEMFLADMLRRFCGPHPGLVIDLRLSDAHVDLAREGIDVAIRIGALADSALMSRRLARIGLVLVAAPDYVAVRGMPQNLEDLSHHACIRDTNLRDRGGWNLTEGGTERRVAVSGPFLVNSARTALDLALAGEGIAYTPDFMARAALRQGRLLRVLPTASSRALDVHAVYLGGRRMPRRLRSFLDFLAENRGVFEGRTDLPSDAGAESRAPSADPAAGGASGTS